MSQVLLTTVGGGLIYLYFNEIKEFTNKGWQKVKDWLSCSLTVESPKLLFVLRQQLEQTYLTAKHLSVTDGACEPQYRLLPGSYTLYLNKYPLTIEYTTNKITIQSYWHSVAELKVWLKTLYQTVVDKQQILIFNFLQSSGWSNPVMRKPRKIIPTKNMQLVLEDVNNFYSEEKAYDEKGYPFRKGYMIVGSSGAGKSSLAELLAQQYDLDIYLINLNTRHMDDGLLISYVAQVPPHSMIVLDEFDKQYSNLTKTGLSLGGLLAALDGCFRLSHGTLFLVLANSIDNIDKEFLSQLLRPGRLDATFTI